MIRFFLLVFCCAGSSTAIADPCGSDFTLDPTGQASVIITSPGYPNDYPADAGCIWTITGPEDYGLMIVTDDFQLEDGEDFLGQMSCLYDSLEIFDVTDGNPDVSLGQFCGTNGPDRLRSSSRKIRIRFESDSFQERPGFKIQVTIQGCKLIGEHLCPSTLEKDHCFTSTQLCDGTKHCPNGDDEACLPGCGIPVKPPLFSTRIVGGIEAKANSWPWQVALVSSIGELKCGGALIDHHWIVTSAQCCRPFTFSPSDLVRVGEHNLAGTLEKNARSYKIAKAIPHENYLPYSADNPVPKNDFCLIKTVEPVLFSDDVSPVCLGSGILPPTGTDCYITGFGTTAVGEPNTNVLRQVDVKITDVDVCNTAYQGDLTEDIVCAYHAGKDSCRRDTGGPLVCPSRSNPSSFELVGVVSFGFENKCAADGYPGIYAKTAFFLDWIAEMTFQDSRAAS